MAALMAAGLSVRVFTIALSVPFLPTLVRAMMDGRLVPDFPASDDPLGRDAALLPRIRPIGDIDEDELAFAEAAAGALAETALDLPPALTPLERRLLLARLVLQWASSA